MAFTIHFICECKLHHFTLHAKPFPPPHTAEAIRQSMQDFLVVNEISPARLFAVTSDHASNMIKAHQGQTYHWLGCICHALNLVIKDGIKAVMGMEVTLDQARAVVNLFHTSTTASAALRRSTGKRHASLQADVPTRWESSLLMLKTIAKRYC